MLRRTRSTPSLEKPEDAPQNIKADTTTEPPILSEKKEYPLIVRKQANRLAGLFRLAEGHEGVQEARQRYRDALKRNGIDEPPKNLEEAVTLIKEVGEFNG